MERLTPHLPNGCVLYFDEYETLNYGSRFTGEARLVHEINRGEFGENFELILDRKLGLDSDRIYRFMHFGSELRYPPLRSENAPNVVHFRSNDSPLPQLALIAAALLAIRYKGSRTQRLTLSITGPLAELLASRGPALHLIEQKRAQPTLGGIQAHVPLPIPGGCTLTGGCGCLVPLLPDAAVKYHESNQIPREQL